MDTIRVKSATGATVLHPVSGRPVTHDDAGENVPHTPHVARRISEGSLVVVPAAKQQPAPQVAKKSDDKAKGAE